MHESANPGLAIDLSNERGPYLSNRFDSSRRTSPLVAEVKKLPKPGRYSAGTSVRPAARATMVRRLGWLAQGCSVGDALPSGISSLTGSPATPTLPSHQYHFARVAERHQFLAVTPVYRIQLVLGFCDQTLHVGLRFIQPLLQPGHLLLHLEHPLNPGQVQTAFTDKTLDAAQPLHVVQ